MPGTKTPGIHGAHDPAGAKKAGQPGLGFCEVFG
jgi:hypothetical protein